MANKRKTESDQHSLAKSAKQKTNHTSTSDRKTTSFRQSSAQATNGSDRLIRETHPVAKHNAPQCADSASHSQGPGQQTDSLPSPGPTNAAPASPAQNALELAQARLLRQAETTSILPPNAFAYKAFEESSTSPSDSEQLLPVKGRNYIFAASQARGSTAPGARLTAGQFNAAQPKWTPEEEQKLRDALRDNPDMPMHEIHETFFPTRAYSSVTGKKRRIILATNRKPRKNAGDGRRSQLRDAMQRFLREHGPFTDTQARLCIQLAAGYRSTPNGDCHHVFAFHTNDVADFSCLATVMTDFRRVCQHKRETKADVLALHQIVAQSLMDFNSRPSSAERVGKMCWGPGGVNFFCLAKWSHTQQTTYRRLAPFQRFNLMNAKADMAWNEPDTRVLATVVVEAIPVKNAQTLEASFVVPDRVTTKSALTGARSGPLILIFLPGEVLFCTLQDVVECTNTLLTGGKCSRTGYNAGSIKVEWRFDPASPAYKIWSATRKVILSPGTPGNLVERLISEYTAATKRRKALILQDWASAHQALL